MEKQKTDLPRFSLDETVELALAIPALKWRECGIRTHEVNLGDLTLRIDHNCRDYIDVLSATFGDKRILCFSGEKIKVLREEINNRHLEEQNWRNLPNLPKELNLKNVIQVGNSIPAGYWDQYFSCNYHTLSTGVGENYFDLRKPIVSTDSRHYRLEVHEDWKMKLEVKGKDVKKLFSRVLDKIHAYHLNGLKDAQTYLKDYGVSQVIIKKLGSLK